jgi:hypothetical protein
MFQGIGPEWADTRSSKIKLVAISSLRG